MKSLKQYLTEESNNIPTKEIIDVLKKCNDTPKEIKNEIDIDKNTIKYIDALKIYNDKCFEWLRIYTKLIKHIYTVEGKDFLTKNLGQKFAEYYRESFNEFIQSIKKFNEICYQYDIDKLNEGFDVKNIDNYIDLYKHLCGLYEFDTKMQKYKESVYNDQTTYKHNEIKQLLDAQTKVSESIKKLFKSTNNLKQFLNAIWQYKNNRLNF